MYKILGLKSQDFVQNSTNYMGGKITLKFLAPNYPDIVKLLQPVGVEVSTKLRLMRGANFDWFFWLVETQNQDTIKFSSIPV